MIDIHAGHSPEKLLQAFRAVSEAALHAADMLERALSDMRAEVSPPCDVEPQGEPRPTFTDVTHSVFHDGDPVYSGTKGECQCFADNHFPWGGYGIGPIQG